MKMVKPTGTYTLGRENLPNEFGLDYMPSRINWVVQSSGVDYISEHDKLRYLVKEDK
ncbi:hypothetical protein F5887DRAFT_964789 [Amanita rubescens]|nr:hypothetical protein F5887DRAFT_964789 [Amanita rubescens]